MASDRKQVERVVNRWVVDFYSFLALDSFKKEQYSEFSSIKDFLGNVLVSAVVSAEIMPLKVLVLQFLSSINEGEKLESIRPLESALILLERICQTCEVSPQDLQNVLTLIQKMIVKIYIKNMELDRAREMVHKYFSGSFANNSDKSYFLSLISLRSKGLDVDENIHFEEFQRQMLAFCEKLWPFSPPFLYKESQLGHQCDKDLRSISSNGRRDFITRAKEAATELNERLVEINSSAPSAASSIANYKHGIIRKSRLEKAFNALAAGTNHITFVQLEEDVESEQSLSLRLSPSEELTGEEEPTHQSPEHASLPVDPQTQLDVVPEAQTSALSQTDSLLRKHKTCSLARLVMEPDSERSFTFPSQQLDEPRNPKSVKDGASRKRLRKTSGRFESSSEPEGPVQRTPSKSSAKKPQKHVDGIYEYSNSSGESSSTPVHRHSAKQLKRAAKDSGSSKWKNLFKSAKETKDSWPEEETFFKQHSGSVNGSFISGNKKMRWTEEETNWLREGVEKFGVGSWSKILSFYNFKDRTNINLKDRWRTMKKLNMV